MAGYFTSNRKVLEHRKLARMERRSRMERERHKRALHIRKTTSCSRQTAWQASRLCDIHRNPYCIRKGHSYLGHMRPTLR